MPTPDQLKSWDRELVWHAFTQMAEYEPFIIERADGCVLVDIDGHEYLDGVSSLWCNVHGHRHPKIDAAIREQLDRVAHVTSLGASNPTTIRLAKRLVDLAPPGLRHVFFSDDGATAVEVAVKMAFQYWRQRPDPRPEKTCYVALGDAYHGDTLGSVSVGGVARFHAMFGPLLFETLRVPVLGNAPSKTPLSRTSLTAFFSVRRLRPARGCGRPDSDLRSAMNRQFRHGSLSLLQRHVEWSRGPTSPEYFGRRCRRMRRPDGSPIALGRRRDNSNRNKPDDRHVNRAVSHQGGAASRPRSDHGQDAHATSITSRVP